MDDRRSLTDEALWEQAARGDLRSEELLAERYARLVRATARPYFLIGGDSEDLLQEGMIGLLSAIRQYSPERQASFRTFAESCVRNRIYSAIRSAQRFKNVPLNGYVPLEDLLYDEDRLRVSSQTSDPEEIILARERVSELLTATSALSAMERRVLALYLDGFSYDEIAGRLGRQRKSVDNAVQRIRRKLT